MEAMFSTHRSSKPAEKVPPSRFFAADALFHRRIAEAGRNELLLKAVDDARAAMFYPMGTVFRHLHPSSNDHHSDLVTAIEAQRPELAASIMIEHVNGTRNAVHELSS